MNNSINPIKQNIRVKQYLGWFITFTFPLAIKELMEMTNRPIIAAAFYWFICGILLRYTMEQRLPYFNPNYKKVKREIILLFLVTFLCGYLYVDWIGYSKVMINRNLVMNMFIFALLNGAFEHLVWINIFDLAGSKLKINGFMAACIYTVLIHILFWSKFMPIPGLDKVLFLLSEGLMFIIPFIIYVKTEDITIWSIQHIIYNLIIVIFGGFGANSFIYIN
ncbi:hypothetical protein BD780_003667 [Clostridium tetanomorphum]|uniref:Uncharacterized protein n=1 Tax=Clostridium tetanomorphum TaxID=1553 RepID=A0A923EAW1_CLOTT|nr:hypothetical protein [Clostridium tetanomorphum]KAJ50853.1 hypothetical protein CTM_15902 [Clostridium tetanomorphum DSM 665]MBC2398344.1 hypothetical protein [Clostridium tetanomorphum]MBP1865496.1 hypothetical protein [Clostridium tetanomorphum]NRS86442.1 hypothetical protein [Clostridium tetanomorphum]NRZ95529.1 hypothetical protein [Clostridium tetanomorphum]